ncbi:hypothetical protein KDL44_01995 [bacterium]|nr:hypothetical protein [bacterium]
MSVVARLAGLLLFSACLLMLQACGSGGEKQDPDSKLTVNLNQPVSTGANAPGLFGYETANISADISGGVAPYNLTWFMGGAGEDQFTALDAAGTTSISVKWQDLAASVTYRMQLLVVDAAGNTVQSNTEFLVSASQDVCRISIDSLTYSDGLINVFGSDPNGGALRFEAAIESSEISISGPFNETATSAEFIVKPNDVLAGGNFTVSVSAYCASIDYFGASDSVSGSFDAFPLADDTLYAIATQTHAAVGEPVRIVVATGLTKDPLMYLYEFGVVCDSGAMYKLGTFDIGQVDENPAPELPIDGAWIQNHAAAFLVTADSQIGSTDLKNGFRRTRFNLTPTFASDARISGALFNFEYIFRQPGVYTLGFDAENASPHTCYLDRTITEEHFWSDISNHHIYNTIVVE